MERMAENVWRISRRIGPTINAYVAGGVLVDAARRQDARSILRQVADHELTLVALTHAHPDHQGAAAAVCEARSLPLACHADDVDAMEGRRPMGTGSAAGRLVTRTWGGPPRGVDRVLEDGDALGDFTVHHAPGHAPGEIVLFREADRVALCGDVIRSMSYLTGRPLLAEPPDAFNVDTARNRTSIRRLADLGPSLILPGHGPAVTDMSAFARFAASLP